MRRKVTVFIIIVICYLLQTTVFAALSFASIAPNLRMIPDIFGGNILGFYALVYMYIGYLNGYFRKMFYPEDIKLPMLLIAGSDLGYNLFIYFFLFLFRNRYDFRYYFLNLMLPELVYTMVITIFLYVIILKINQRLEVIEKRSASKFV